MLGSNPINHRAGTPPPVPVPVPVPAAPVQAPQGSANPPNARAARRPDGAAGFLRRQASLAGTSAATEMNALTPRPAPVDGGHSSPAPAPLPTTATPAAPAAHAPDAAHEPKNDSRSAMRRLLDRTPQVDIDMGPVGKTRTGNIMSAVDSARVTAAEAPKPKEHGVIGRHLGSVARSDAARQRVLNPGPGKSEALKTASDAARTALLKNIGNQRLVQERMQRARTSEAAFRQTLAQHLGASNHTDELADALLHAPTQATGPGAADPLLAPVLMAQALAEPAAADAATGQPRPANGEDAHAALSYLINDMNWNALTSPAPADQPAAQHAWRAAEVLSRSDEGFNALVNVMHKAPEAHERESLRTFLQAADQLRRQPDMAQYHDATPHDLLQKAPSMGNSVVARALQASAAVLKDSASPGVAYAMTSKEAFSRMVTQQLGDTRATSDLIDKLTPAGGSAAPVRLDDQLMLAHALTPAPVLAGAAPGPLTGAHALGALDHLTDHMDWNELTAPTAAQDTPTARRAWQSAEVLSRTSHGFDVLMEKMAHPPPAGEQREAMRAFLQAADALRHSGKRGAPISGEHPSMILRQSRASAYGNTLATRTLRASADRLAGATPRNTAAAAKAVGDLFAWRQGAREDGPGTTQAMMTGRLGKFVKTAVPRAETTGKRNALANMAGVNNSALTPLAKGVQGTHLASLPKELENYCGAFQGACAKLNEAASALPAASSGTAAGERTAVTTLLREWATMTPKPKKPEQFTCAALSQAPAGSPLRELAGKPVTLDLLTHLAKHIRLPAPAVETTLAEARAMEQAADLKPAAMTREEMATVLNTLIAKMQSNSRLKLSDGAIKGISTAGASAIVAEAMAGALLVGVRADLRYDYGRHTTFELARTGQGYEIFLGTTENHRAQGGVGVKLGHDIKVGSKDAAVQTKVRVGGGVTMTPVDYENSRGRGIIFRVERPVTPETRENLDKEWASVAFDDAKMVDTTQRLMAFLLDPESAKLTEEGLWNKLAADFGEGVSVGWQDNKTTTNRQKLAVDFGAGVSGKVGNVSLRAGGSINLTAENTSGQHNTVTEVGGTGNLAQRKFGTAANLSTGVNVGVGMSTTVGANDPKASASTSPAPDAAAASKASGTSVSSGSLDLLNAQAVLVEQNQSVRVSLPTLDGKLISRSTYLDHEFVGVDAYIEKIEQDRALWARTMTSVHVRDRGAAGEPKPEIGEDMFAAFTDADKAEGTRQLDELIATARAEAKPNFKYLVRMRMKPEAAQKYDSFSDLAKQAGNKFGKGDCKEQQRLLLADPNSWLPAKLATSEKIGEKDSSGLKAGLRAFGLRQAEGARELRAFKCE